MLAQLIAHTKLPRYNYLKHPPVDAYDALRLNEQGIAKEWTSDAVYVKPKLGEPVSLGTNYLRDESDASLYEMQSFYWHPDRKIMEIRRAGHVCAWAKPTI